MVREGTGIHTGRPARIRISPQPFGTGVRFRRGGQALSMARAEPGATVLCGPGVRLGTPEHLLAAISGLWLTDLLVEVSGGDEVPALDGSAAGWVTALDDAGCAEGPPLSCRALPRVRVEEAGGWAASDPESDALSVVVDFGARGPSGALTVRRREAAFRTEVAWARTFVHADDIATLRAAGRGAGADAQNTAVWPSGPLRSPDEPVRHKLLDLWGDLALLGPYAGSVTAHRGSHRLHHALIEAIRAAW